MQTRVEVCKMLTLAFKLFKFIGVVSMIAVIKLLALYVNWKYGCFATESAAVKMTCYFTAN